MNFFEGTVWYKKTFMYHKDASKKLFLHFGAVNYIADVYLNSEKIGSHEGGFTPFQFEITDKVKGVLKSAECLYNFTQIEAALKKISDKITEKLKDENPLVLCVMVGALIPAGHILSRLNFPLEVDYIHATRYRGTTRGGDLHWLVEPRKELKDRTVLIIDDVMDAAR